MKETSLYKSVENLSDIDQNLRLRRAKLATRLAFFIAGFGLACWAPLVPYAKERVGANTAEFGTILLCLGLGAVIGMPAAGSLSEKWGARLVIIVGSAGIISALPLMAIAPSAAVLGFALLIFGAAIGAIDVASNIHGSEVQNAARTALMSGFHALYSIGGLIGASAMTAVIASGATPVFATAMAALIILICIVCAGPRFFPTRSHGGGPVLVLPRGVVLLIGLLALATFLVEGAMLDWGALLLTQSKQLATDVSGAGYAVFAMAMTCARFIGDRFVSAVGERKALIIGAAMTSAGITLAVASQPLYLVLIGFAIIGFGAANVVPVLFTLAGRQTVMPASHAIAAASILGYLGMLLGPALIGYTANVVGLLLSFSGLAFIMLLVAAAAPLATQDRR